MTSARATSARMPYKQDIMNDTTPLSDQEYKQYRVMCGIHILLPTYEVHKPAQLPQAPTKGAIKALRKVMAYLANDCRCLGSKETLGICAMTRRQCHGYK